MIRLEVGGVFFYEHIDQLALDGIIDRTLGYFGYGHGRLGTST